MTEFLIGFLIGSFLGVILMASAAAARRRDPCRNCVLLNHDADHEENDEEYEGMTKTK